MMRRAILALALGVTAASGNVAFAQGQTYSTGQTVFASPSGASNNWYSGCIVGSGRNNRSYQVECAGTTYWVVGDNISLQPPQSTPDPMRPGQTLIPVVTPSHPAPAATQAVTIRTPVAARPQTAATPAASFGGGGGGYAAEMHRKIEQDKADAASAKLVVGKYSCYASGRYTFSDLYITGPHSYRVEPGGSGAYSYAGGALTFSSGPYAGAYSRMVDGHTVGVSAKGNTNLGTQCEFTK